MPYAELTMGLLRAEVLSARLRDLGLITPRQLEEAKQELFNSQERFSSILTRQGLIRDEEVGKRLASQLGAIPQRLDISTPPPAVAGRVPSALWLSHRLAPLKEGEGRLLVATDDPLSVFALDFFSRQCGCPLEAVLVSEQELLERLEALGKIAHAPATSPTPPPHPASAAGREAPPLQPLSQAGPEKKQDRGHEAGVSPSAAKAAAESARAAAGGGFKAPSAPGATRPSPPVSTAAAGPLRRQETAAQEIGPLPGAGDEPIIRLVDSMLAEAVRMRASDIHVQPSSDRLSVRYRIDGVLHDVNSPPKALHGPVASRIKIMSGLNIAEKRLPQDGRLQLSVEGRPLDVRVSILPAMHGESIVMRLLDRSQPIRGLPEMGLLPEDQDLWETLIHRPHGMVLVTGPTGSGKTTTLYGALTKLNQPDRKLITVEDPVEYQLSGVNQVAVKSSIGLTFAAGLRSMLRQAPDVILVGEIRDQETAQIAVQAALTGHLVLSTLHTNDAPSAITRLIDMGIPPFLVASTIQGVMAQRLVRRICPDCRLSDNATEEEQAFLAPLEVKQLIHSNGCDKCHGSGFLGRIGIFELLMVSEAIRHLIVEKASASAIRAEAVRRGMRGLKEDGCVKIREGWTTMAEVLRVVAGSEG